MMVFSHSITLYCVVSCVIQFHFHVMSFLLPFLLFNSLFPKHSIVVFLLKFHWGHFCGFLTCCSFLPIIGMYLSTKTKQPNSSSDFCFRGQKLCCWFFRSPLLYLSCCCCCCVMLCSVFFCL